MSKKFLLIDEWGNATLVTSTKEEVAKQARKGIDNIICLNDNTQIMYSNSKERNHKWVPIPSMSVQEYYEDYP